MCVGEGAGAKRGDPLSEVWMACVMVSGLLI